MKKIYTFLRSKSLFIMMTGIIVAITGLLFFVKYRYYSGIYKSISFYVAIAGFCIYVTGRIFEAIRQKHLRDTQRSSKNE
jgi:hypothetical protein